MERALEVEPGDLDCRLTSCDLGHITNLISLGLGFLTRNVERVECSYSEGTSASSTVTLDIRIDYLKDCREWMHSQEAAGEEVTVFPG